MIMFCEGGHFTLMPNILKQIFGASATQLYGFAFSFTGFTSFAILGLQLGFLTASTYKYFFFAGSLTSCVSLIMLIFWFTDKKYVAETETELKD